MDVPEPVNVLFFLIRIAIAVLVIVVLVIFFISTKAEIYTKDMERAGLEIADNLMSSNLTKTKGVFIPEKLSEIDQKIIEPVQMCEFSYYARIKTDEKAECKIDADCLSFCRVVCGGEQNCKCGLLGTCYCKKGYLEKNTYEWGFGDSSAQAKQQYIWKIPVSIYTKANRSGSYYDTVKPALLEITVHYTWLSEITCLARKAQTTHEAQTILLGCIKPNSFMEEDDCYLCIQKNGPDQICMCHKEGNALVNDECRYMQNLPLENFNSGYQPKNMLIAAEPEINNGIVTNIKLVIRSSKT